MKKLVKLLLARLIILSAASYQLAAATIGFANPKIFFDFLTKRLDGAVTPVPYLQLLNLTLSLIVLAWEWPLPWVIRISFHRQILIRIIICVPALGAAILLYQATNAALYYLIGICIYVWAY
ncbi:hypothetical protein V8F33_008504 [Rhypophila sp. PSN 637]